MPRQHFNFLTTLPVNVPVIPAILRISLFLIPMHHPFQNADRIIKGKGTASSEKRVGGGMGRADTKMINEASFNYYFISISQYISESYYIIISCIAISFINSESKIQEEQYISIIFTEDSLSLLLW